jgi:hypothetical protein
MEMGYKQTNNIIERAAERRDAIFKKKRIEKSIF